MKDSKYAIEASLWLVSIEKLCLEFYEVYFGVQLASPENTKRMGHLDTILQGMSSEHTNNAESGGFEPPLRFPVNTLSKRAP